MKWFEHPSGLRNTPKMVSIRRQFGILGYARAIVILETLAENGGTGEDFQPELSLNERSTDLNFWAYELGTENGIADVQELFEFLAEIDFLDKEALAVGVVRAPMLLDQLAEWEKRRLSRKTRDNSRATPEWDSGGYST